MNEDKKTQDIPCTICLQSCDKTLVPSFSFGKREDPGDECCWNPIWRPVFALEVAYASEFVCLRTTSQDIEL